MTNSKNIMQLLCISDEQYEAMFLKIYIHWCLDRVKEYYRAEDDIFHKQLQKVMANTAISKYFNEQWEDLEHQAYHLLKLQKHRMPLPKLREHYDVQMADIFKHYPKPLLDAAQKLTIINEPHDYNAN